MNAVHFSSNTDLWATPQDFFDKVNAEFGFTLDVCATPLNAKCARYFTAEDDGLAQDWSGERVWMNPPYGRAISAWMRKAFEAAQAGSLVVCLVPARTDTAWWHDFSAPHEVRFVRGRLKFGGSQNSAPFPSALVVMRPSANHLSSATCQTKANEPATAGVRKYAVDSRHAATGAGDIMIAGGLDGRAAG